MTSVLSSADEARFWSKVDQSAGLFGCWPWMASRHPRGYGHFWIGPKVGGQQQAAHRVAYELRSGPVPAGLVLDHVCRYPPCVNPAHLEAVSQQVNTLRGVGPTATNAIKTHCKRGHAFTADNLTPQKVRLGWRECRTCRNARHRALRERQRIATRPRGH